MATLITLREPQSAAAEAYHSLRTTLEFANLEAPLRTILLTSADPTTDKSVTVANLAVVMAQAGNRVLVVDGDLRKPQQHELFGLSNQNGLSDWLEKGGTPVLQKTSIENLQLLAAGPVAQNPVSLLSSTRLANVLSELSSKADVVLCDAPPLLSVSDGALWASKVDGVVLLVTAGRTRREHALNAKELLTRVHARLIGAVLLNAEQDASLGGYGG